MTDVLDRASQLEEQQRKQAIGAQRLKPQEKPNELHGHRYCLDCDIEIKTQRLIAAPNAVRCVDCQEIFEHENKHFSR